MALLKLAAILLAGGATLVPAATATTASTSGAHAPSTSAPAASGGGKSVVLDCLGAPQTRPAKFVIACGDGNNYLAHLHWSTWTSGSATGTGTDMANDCKPYCAIGHFHGYPVKVRMDLPVTWTGHHGEKRFTRLTLTYTGARPAGSPAHVTWPLPRPAAEAASA